MIAFLTENRRWLATGLLLAFGSSFGQTWFISLFAGEIRASYGLSDGDWGLIYTVATLSSAALLLGRGSLADTVPLSRLVIAITVCFASGALLMAIGWSVWTLGLAVFLLRFCGQGMFTHIEVTAIARWFVTTRGRALAITNLGFPLGEVLMPLPVILLIGAIGWRASWGIVAAVLLVVFVPLFLKLLAQDRVPRGADGPAAGSAGLGGVHWTRSQALNHWLFWALVPFFLTPGFIGTVIFFHQVHVSEVKDWSLAAMTPGYTAYAAMTISFLFVGGWICDRYGPALLLPVLMLPMGLGITLLGPLDMVWGWFLVLALIGISQGLVGAVTGTLLPFVYGTDHLGAIRAMAIALMVLSTAIGPGVTGLFIDGGVMFPDQGVAMGIWCVGLSIALVPVMWRLQRPV